MTILLEVSDIACGYDGGKVLDDVALSLSEGEIVALIGRNGVGKTTLMRALIGLLPLSKGSIRIDGKEIGHAPAYSRVREGMAYVPQGREIFPALTVLENLKVGALGSNARDSEKTMQAVMEYFPVLQTKRQQMAGTMSGGQQQQLAIARALLGNPCVLLLDEPSEGIQPSIVTSIGETLLEIVAQSRIGVLLVEQDLGMVEHIADRCCVMDKGRIVQWLSKSQISDTNLMRQQLAL